MNIMTSEVQTMFQPMMNSAPTIWSHTCLPLPSMAPFKQKY
jgi:hypothetical protein